MATVMMMMRVGSEVEEGEWSESRLTEGYLPSYHLTYLLNPIFRKQ